MKKTMTYYKVNEIFYSVQAEGKFAGTPAVFVRLSGCNLECGFCDTAHEKFTLMTKEEIEREVLSFDKTENSIVVFTGGEPLMQLSDDEPILFQGNNNNRTITVETNGTVSEIPFWIDWVTVSPKYKIELREIDRINELKFVCGVFDENYLTKEVEPFATAKKIKLFIQPMADKNGKFDISKSLEFVKKNTAWNLSVQWHKLTGVR